MKQSNEMHTNEMPLNEQIHRECEAMAKYAYTSGMHVPADLVELLEIISTGKTGRENQTEIPGMKRLSAVHARLSRLIAPAKPRTILLLDTESKKKGYFKFLGPVSFIRRMVLVSIISLMLFILISLSPAIDDKPGTWSLFTHSGLTLLLKEFFLLSAAGLGASFNALFIANRYIVRGTFDPRYESSYWIRLIVGIMAGMIMAALIPIENYMEADLGKPALAMLGGFSAKLVYQVISRLIDTLGSLFKGDAAGAVKAREEQINARIAGEHEKNRYALAADLMKIQDLVKPDTKPEEIKKMISALTQRLTGTEE